MKITKEFLKQIIKEEISKLNENEEKMIEFLNSAEKKLNNIPYIPIARIDHIEAHKRAVDSGGAADFLKAFRAAGGEEDNAGYTRLNMFMWQQGNKEKYPNIMMYNDKSDTPLFSQSDGEES